MATKTVNTQNHKRKQQSAAASYAEDVKSSGAPLWGNIITWDAGGRHHSFAEVVAAIKAASLDEKIARALCASHAWSRACRQLAQERVIDKVRTDGDKVTFQFTRSFLDESGSEAEIRYTKEALICLDKETGKVSCNDARLEALAQAELDKAIENRTPSDITKYVQKAFEQQADLWPIRRQGGAYMVPIERDEFLAKIGAFLTSLGGELTAFPVAKGTKHGDKAAQTAAVDGLGGTISEYEKAVAAFGTDTRPATLEKQAEKIKTLRVKIEAYAHVLGERRGELMNALQKAGDSLKARVASITAAKTATWSVDCDYCRAPNICGDDAKECVCRECGKTFPVE